MRILGKEFEPVNARSVRNNRVNQDIERLRAVAILLVLVSHGQALFSWIKYHSLIAGYQFQIGVDLFFIISGYVIAMSLFRELHSRRENDTAKMFLYRFWVKRAFRLLPAAIVCILISSFLSCVAYGENIWVMFTAGAAALLNVFNFYLLHAVTNNVSVGMLEPYWSLSLEEQFYIIFPIVVLLASTKPKIALVAIVGAVGIEAAFSVIPNLFWFIRIDGLCLGVFLACVSSYISRAGKFLFFPRMLGVGLLLICVPIALGYIFFIGGFVAYQTIPLLCCALLVIFAIMDKDVFDLPIIGGLLSYIGSRSYTIYLLHLTWFYSVGRLLLSVGESNSVLGVCLAVISILLFILIVELMYRFIETPFRGYGKKIASQLEPVNISESKVVLT